MEAIKNDPRLQGDCDKVAVIKLVIDEQVTSFRRENCLKWMTDAFSFFEVFGRLSVFPISFGFVWEYKCCPIRQ